MAWIEYDKYKEVIESVLYKKHPYQQKHKWQHGKYIDGLLCFYRLVDTPKEKSNDNDKTR